MQDLRELTYLLGKNTIKAGHILPDMPDSKLVGLYEGIVNDQFYTDEEAAAELYNDDKENRSYQKLRNDLKKRLVNALFLMDFKQLSSTQRQVAYYECHKDWAAAMLLMGKKAKVAGIALCRKIIRQAKKYEFTELVLHVAGTLRLHYGTLEGDYAKFELYNKMFKEYTDIWQEENQAEELYTELIIKYINNKATKTEIHAIASDYYARLQDSMQRYDSYRLHLCGNLIRLMIYSSVNDYKNTVQVCDEAIAFFEAKEYLANVPLQVFFYQKIVCYTQLRQYRQGKSAAEKCLAFIESGAFNWFKLQELYLLLAFHTGQYQQAYNTLRKVVLQKQFATLPPNILEMWKIYEAYVYYLCRIEKISPARNDKRYARFRPGKFGNETPIFSKDKRGMNIPILIIQILFMIEEQKFNKVIDKIEAIEKYCSRYLRQDDTFRSNCFIKMLLQIPAANFHRAAVLRKSEDLLKKLKSVPIEMANQTHEIEIIPYEDLWNFAINTLGNTIRQGA